jgi:DNA-binding Xre family transcriptional regulator
MSKPQIIKTPEGGELAVLPRADYERLREAAEDAADVRAYDAAMRKIDAGETDRIPIEFVDRMLAGENPVRVWRQFRGLKVKELAEAAGIAANYLSLIETGKRDGTVKVMKALAEALGVDIDDIV